MEYKKFNNNPLNKKTGDCVIRAISEGLGLSWDEVFNGLNEVGFKIKEPHNATETIKEYLKNYLMIVPKAIKGEKRLKVKDLSGGTYILSIANHITTIKEGILKDTWDCREKAVYRYWIIKKGDL